MSEHSVCLCQILFIHQAKRPHDFLDATVESLFQVSGADPDHVIALAPKPPVALLIPAHALWNLMKLAIDLDHQLLRMNGKIRDIWPDRNLASDVDVEMVAKFPKFRPEPPFPIRHLAPQLSCETYR
ncbi:hypothetical protein GGR23_000388 [Gellertiella hungarica]|uniref:Uncharacterized protein n=1 Tax=Gellertiella hungarica TaxID=1572859 RepID=A0A7W6J338_9HYPH|nr:hypothetical protein [Gellertiella hungarica]